MEEILALDLLTLTAHTRAAGDAFDAASHRQALAQVLPKSTVFKVRRGAQMAGYAYMWPKGDGLWFVGGFAVHPDHRAGPVLKSLLVDVVAFAKREGVTELQSHVYKTNVRSLVLHKRLGFKVIDENEKGFAFSLPLKPSPR